MGVPMEDIRITAADTGVTPLDPGTFGSGVTVRAGNAARLAAVEARDKLFEFVADKIGSQPGRPGGQKPGDIRQGLSRNQNEPERCRKGLSVCGPPHAHRGPGFLVGRPPPNPPPCFKENGNFAPNYSFMTQAAEVEVDLKPAK